MVRTSCAPSGVLQHGPHPVNLQENHHLGTSFFESLAKKSLATMDNLFKRANKHFLLGDYIRVDYSAGLGHQSSDQERPCKKL